MSMEVVALRPDEILLAYRNAIRPTELSGTVLRARRAFCRSINLALWNFYLSKVLEETRVSASVGRVHSTRVQTAAKRLLAAIRQQGTDAVWREVSRSGLRRKQRLRELFGTENPIESLQKAAMVIEVVRDCAGDAAAVFAGQSKRRKKPRHQKDMAAQILFGAFLSAWLLQYRRSWLRKSELDAFARFTATACANYIGHIEKLPKLQLRQSRSAIQTLRTFKSGAICARYHRSSQARLRRSSLARPRERTD